MLAFSCHFHCSPLSRKEIVMSKLEILINTLYGIGAACGETMVTAVVAAFAEVILLSLALVVAYLALHVDMKSLDFKYAATSAVAHVFSIGLITASYVAICAANIIGIAHLYDTFGVVGFVGGMIGVGVGVWSTVKSFLTAIKRDDATVSFLKATIW